ncbi:MAG: hypothetical protein E6J06_07885 [Chloroflexi bacterium]|nr:MAG: hypothetical protein E6J06_07885 [Chloroflexota bacterium]
MQLENSFQVGAPPERVFGYLLDVNKVVGCVPGAELTEVVDASTFKGKVKVKVGPISVAYNGTARISERSESERTATLTAEGRETTGQGTARATAHMTVEPAGDGSTVRIVTDYHVAGRVASFGRGVMEDVSPPDNPSGGATANSSPPSTQPASAQPINAFGLFLHLISLRLQRLFGRRGSDTRG